MAVLTYTEISNLALDALQANVATDAPFTAAELLRYINDAYNMLWEESGGGIKVAKGSTLWVTQPDSSGALTGKTTDINEITHLWALTADNFGGAAGDVELEKVDSSELFWRRAHSGVGTYTVPKIYAVSRLATATDADVNKVQVDIYPAAAGRYYPAEYVPQFTPLDNATITVPDLNDTESRDVAFVAALWMAPAVGRAELVPGISARVSERTAKIIARRTSAQVAGKQDR